MANLGTHWKYKNFTHAETYRNEIKKDSLTLPI